MEPAVTTTTSAVRQAATVLEEQLSAVVVGAQTVTSGFASSKTVDQAAFNDALQQARSSGQQLISAAAAQVPSLGSEDVQAVASRFAQDAQNMFNAFIDLATVVPEILNRLAATAAPPPTAKPPGQPEPAAPAGGSGGSES
jgi:hypothetical protein